MIRAVLRMEIRPEDNAEFERVWRAVAGAVSEHWGVLQQTLVRDGEGENAYLVISDWPNSEEFRLFERSEEQDRLTAPLRKLRSSASLSVYEVIEQIS